MDYGMINISTMIFTMIYYDKKWDDQWMMGNILLWIYYHRPIIMFTIMINVCVFLMMVNIK